MSATPLQVLSRPFAIEPVTDIMLPDGIFDNAIYNLRIAAHFTNTLSSALTNVTLYLESVGDPASCRSPALSSSRLSRPARRCWSSGTPTSSSPRPASA